MSVTAQTPYADFIAAPGATLFSTGFRLLLASDLVVKVDGVVVTTGFTVSSLGAGPGSDVTFGTPMVGGEVVELIRAVPKTRLTDYQQLGDFQAPTVNDDFDRLVMMLQDSQFLTELSILLPVGDAAAPMTIPEVAERALKFFAFDASGNAIAAEGAADVPVSAYMATVLVAVNAAAARTALGAQVAGNYAASGAITASGLTQATARMLGRSTAGTGAVEEISIGSGLTLAAGSLSASGKTVVQIQTFQTGALASGSSAWPDDNTIPQISEGVQFMSLDFTPTNVANLLEIDVVFISAASTANEAAGCGLFRDAVADALAAMQLNTGTGYGVANATFKHIMTADTTSLITFRVRAGRRDGGALYFNGGTGGAQRYGGVMASRITVKEYLP